MVVLFIEFLPDRFHMHSGNSLSCSTSTLVSILKRLSFFCSLDNNCISSGEKPQLRMHAPQVTTSVDKGRPIDAMFLDFCKAFDRVFHNIFLSKLERHRSNVWTVWWMRNWLDGCIQKVLVNSSMSRWRRVASGVSWQFVLGPVY